MRSASDGGWADAEKFYLVVRGGTLATDAGTERADVGISAGVITACGRRLGPGTREIDATGRLVLPGGVDAHCHVDQKSSSGLMTADDFFTAGVSAACGGTTTIIPFAAQHRASRCARSSRRTTNVPDRGRSSTTGST